MRLRQEKKLQNFGVLFGFVAESQSALSKRNVQISKA